MIKLVFCCAKHVDILQRSPTHNLNVNNCSVHMVLNLNSHLVFARVAALCFTDEDDAVTVSVADVNVRLLNGLAFFQPGDFWPWFALQKAPGVY